MPIVLTLTGREACAVEHALEQALIYLTPEHRSAATTVLNRMRETLER